MYVCMYIYVCMYVPMYVWFNFPDIQYFFGASKISDFNWDFDFNYVLLIIKIEEDFETLFFSTSNSPTS